jgi:hypothetical protein
MYLHVLHALKTSCLQAALEVQLCMTRTMVAEKRRERCFMSTHVSMRMVQPLSRPITLKRSKTACREICVAYERIEGLSAGSEARNVVTFAEKTRAEAAAGESVRLYPGNIEPLNPNQAASEGDEGAVYAQLEQAVGALLRLMTFCGLPSPWEAINMLK